MLCDGESLGVRLPVIREACAFVGARRRDALSLNLLSLFLSLFSFLLFSGFTWGVIPPGYGGGFTCLLAISLQCWITPCCPKLAPGNPSGVIPHHAPAIDHPCVVSAEYSRVFKLLKQRLNLTLAGHTHHRGNLFWCRFTPFYGKMSVRVAPMHDRQKVRPETSCCQTTHA